jgi:hypothetical protein
MAGWQRHYTEGKRLLEESLAISREMDDRQGMAYTLYNLAEVVQFLGLSPKARRLADCYDDLSRLDRTRGNRCLRI